MNLGLRSSILMVALATCAIPAISQQPPDVVQSDDHENTAMGTNALFSAEGAQSDTAAGFSTLYMNTTGSNNTAVGQQAKYSNTQGSYNTACGANSLSANSTGIGNTAPGGRDSRQQSDGILQYRHRCCPAVQKQMRFANESSAPFVASAWTG